MVDNREIRRMGRVVTFDDPHGSTDRFVAAFIPGAIDSLSGEPIELAWVDSFGGAWEEQDILRGNPRIIA